MPEHDASALMKEGIAEHQETTAVPPDLFAYIFTDLQELISCDAFQGNEEERDEPVESDEIWDVFLLDEEYEQFPEEGDFELYCST